MRSFMLGLVAACVFAAGCALTSKSKPVDIRWFAADVATSTAQRAEARGAQRLSLGRVTSSAFLRNPIVVRKSSHEVTTYDDARWTEYPETYLRRSLAHALFDSGRFVQGLGGQPPTLDVELVAFEEMLHGERRTGHVQITYRLHDGDAVLATGMIDVERPAATTEDVAAVVAAITAALDEATARVSKEVDAHYPAPVAASAP